MSNEKGIKNKSTAFYKVKTCGNLKASIKDVDTSGRIVSGFYNTSNFFDSDCDVMMDGAAQKSIQERGVNSSATAKIKHALNHDLTQLPGQIKTLEYRELDGISGIYFETKMSNTTLGNDTLQNYLEKVYDNHSIGFQYINAQRIDDTGDDWDKALSMLINPDDAKAVGTMFLIKEIALWEGSTVAFGANSLTPFLGVKSGNKESLKLALIKRIDLLSHTLKTGSQSDDMMKTFELQTLQLKQMICELSENVDLGGKKEAIISLDKKDEEKNIKNKIDYTYLSNRFKL